MQPSDAFFAGSRYAIFGATARGRMHGSLLIGALKKSGKQAVAIGSEGGAVKGAETALTLEAAGAVDGVVVLPPAPWDADAAAFTESALHECKSRGLERVWIYTAGDAAPAVEIATREGIDPCAGKCPCLYIQGGGFPHNLHRALLKLVHQL